MEKNLQTELIEQSKVRAQIRHQPGVQRAPPNHLAARFRVGIVAGVFLVRALEAGFGRSVVVGERFARHGVRQQVGYFVGAKRKRFEIPNELAVVVATIAGFLLVLVLLLRNDEHNECGTDHKNWIPHFCCCDDKNSEERMWISYSEWPLGEDKKEF